MTKNVILYILICIFIALIIVTGILFGEYYEKKYYMSDKDINKVNDEIIIKKEELNKIREENNKFNKNSENLDIYISNLEEKVKAYEK